MAQVREHWQHGRGKQGVHSSGTGQAELRVAAAAQNYLTSLQCFQFNLPSNRQESVSGLVRFQALLELAWALGHISTCYKLSSFLTRT